MKSEKTNKINQRREALNIHNPVQVERSDTQRGVGKTTAYCCCLLLLLLCPAVLPAQTNGVEVSSLNVGAGAVTFEVSWDRSAVPSVWSDSVWVFVDYNDAGVMRRLLLTGATLTETSAPGYSRVEGVPGNTSGVWVVGNARSAANTSGSFSATVQLLTATANFSGACVYASNYPPVGVWDEGSGTVTFTGTPGYDLVLRDGSGDKVSRQSNSPFDVPASYTFLSFTDKTGAPGKIITYVSYCAIDPGGVYGEDLPWVAPACVSFVGGEIRGEDVVIVPSSCVSFAGGEIRGEDITVVPRVCEEFKAGSITGPGIVLPPDLVALCGGFGGGEIYGEGLPWVDPVCVSFGGGEIRGEDVVIVPSSCVSFGGGEIRGRDVSVVPRVCEDFKAGSITGPGIVLPPDLVALCGGFDSGEIRGEDVVIVPSNCVSFVGGEIRGEDVVIVPSSCVSFGGGEIRGRDVTVVPRVCEDFKAGSITGPGIVGLM